MACNVGPPPVDPALTRAPTPEQVNEALGESSRRMEAAESIAVLGWHVEVTGARVHWRECSALTTCGTQDRETDALNLLRMERVGQSSVTTPDGPRTVDVQRLTLRVDSEVKP
jgi:hypothetical protein